MTYATKEIYQWLLSEFIKVRLVAFIVVVLSCSVNELYMDA